MKQEFSVSSVNIPIFISYAREDTFATQILVSCLHSIGVQPEKIFWDQRLEEGRAWQDDLAKAIERVSGSENGVFIVLFSNYWRLSDFCIREFNHAAKHNSKVLIFELGPKSSIQGMPFDGIQTDNKLYQITANNPKNMIADINSFLRNELRQEIARLDSERNYITLSTDATYARLIGKLKVLVTELWKQRDQILDDQMEIRHQIQGFYESFGNSDLNVHIQHFLKALDPSEQEWTPKTQEEQYNIVLNYLDSHLAQIDKSNPLYHLESLIDRNDY